MSKKIYFVLIVFMIVLGADGLIGLVSGKLIKNVPDIGVNQTNTAQALFKRKADVLILGSSRANHSFDSKVLEKECKQSVYNAGRDGQNMVYDAIVFYSFLERCTPKIVVLDLAESMLDKNWNAAIREMNCYYGLSSSIDGILNERYNKLEQLKLKSNIYRYNNTWQWLLKAYTGKEVAYLDGYRPMPVNETSNMKANIIENDKFVVDSANLSLLNRMVETCKSKKIKLLVTYTPTLTVCRHGFIDWISNYCSGRHLPFYNAMMDEDFLKHPDLFYDYTHLNENGARIFTRKFAKWVVRHRSECLLRES